MKSILDKNYEDCYPEAEVIEEEEADWCECPSCKSRMALIYYEQPEPIGELLLKNLMGTLLAGFFIGAAVFTFLMFYRYFYQF